MNRGCPAGNPVGGESSTGDRSGRSRSTLRRPCDYGEDKPRVFNGKQAKDEGFILAARRLRASSKRPSIAGRLRGRLRAS